MRARIPLAVRVRPSVAVRIVKRDIWDLWRRETDIAERASEGTSDARIFRPRERRRRKGRGPTRGESWRKLHSKQTNGLDSRGFHISRCGNATRAEKQPGPGAADETSSALIKGLSCIMHPPEPATKTECSGLPTSCPKEICAGCDGDTYIANPYNCHCSVLEHYWVILERCGEVFLPH